MEDMAEELRRIDRMAEELRRIEHLRNSPDEACRQLWHDTRMAIIKYHYENAVDLSPLLRGKRI